MDGSETANELAACRLQAVRLQLRSRQFVTWLLITWGISNRERSAPVCRADAVSLIYDLLFLRSPVLCLVFETISDCLM